MESKREARRGMSRTTVEQAREACRACYQRHRILRELLDVLELRWGQKAGEDYELVPTPFGYEVPIKDVVGELRAELKASAMKSHERYRRLGAARTDLDEGLLEEHGVG